MTEQYCTEQQYEARQPENFMMHTQQPSQYFWQFQNYNEIGETSQGEITQPSIAQDMQNSQQQEFNENQTEADEQQIEVESLKVKHKEAADLLREETKQMIFLQVTGKTTVNILHEQQTDVIQDICETEKEVDTATTQNQIMEQHIIASDEEMLKCKEKIKNIKEISNQLMEFYKNVNASYEELQQTRLKNKNLLQKINDREEICSNISNIKLQLKKASEGLDKPNDDIKKKNSLLKEEIAEKRILLNSLLAKEKDLDEEIDKRNNDTEKAETQKYEFQQKLNDKNKALEDLKIKIHQVEENKKAHEANLKAVEASKLKRFQKLQLQRDEINNSVIERKQENEILTMALKNLKEQELKIETSLSEIVKQLEILKHNLEMATKKNLDVKPSHEQSTIVMEMTDLDTEILQLEKLTQITKYENAKEKNDLVIKKCEAEKQQQIEVILKERYQEKIQNLEKTKQKDEEISVKVENLKNNQTLKDLIEKNADIKASLEYLTDKANTIKEQFEKFKSDIEQLKFENNDIVNLIQKLTEEHSNLKTNMRLPTRTNQYLSGILKAPQPKTPPLSPKKVTFDLTDSESVKSAVEVEKVEKLGLIQDQTSSAKFNESQDLKGLPASLLESTRRVEMNSKSLPTRRGK